MPQKDELTLLKTAVSGLVFVEHGKLPASPGDLKSTGFVYARIDEKGKKGYLPHAASAISDLATAFHCQTERHRRGIEFKSLRVALADSIFQYFGVDPKSLTNDHLSAVKDEIDVWLARQAANRTHFVPCTLFPYEANRFEVGPVRFIHISKLGEELGQNDPIAELRGETFLRALQEAYASWVAIVEVNGAEEKKSLELADLAIDIAISGLHLVLPQDFSERMARINGRVWPSWTCRLFKVGEVEQQNVTNAQPGRLMLPPVFEDLIMNGKPILDSVGRRITSFLDLDNSFCGLERSWCDAAYWFHEALAEPLDTIAMAKLETTIEILMSAGSSRMSTARIRKAFSVFFGLDENDLLSSEAQISVNDFSKSIVEARSRVLHGTWSTLTNEMQINRSDVTVLAWQLLLQFTIWIDAYLLTSPQKVNDVDLLLDWIASEKQKNTP